MTDTLSDTTIHLVKATVPALQEHGLAITKRMYERMFRNEEIRDLFNQSHHGETGSQPKALASAHPRLCAEHRQSRRACPAVERIAQKHVGLNILPEHYPHVAEALLGAIKDVLGEAATDEILAAWGEAYWFLAHVLIGREKAIYTSLAAPRAAGTAGATSGSRASSGRARSSPPSCCGPEDGQPVLRHQPGQYLTFWIEVPGQHPLKRNYSISSAPNGETYRISVKREPQGIASTWLHDQTEVGTVLKVAPPAGEFFLNEESPRPVVLLSGGVGLTPMMSMLETIAARHPNKADPLRARHPERLDPCHEGPRPVPGGAHPNIRRDLLRRAAPGGSAGEGLRSRGPDLGGLVAGQHATGRGGLLPVRPAAVPAGVRGRAGAGRRPVEPHPLRVLRTCRRDPRRGLRVGPAPRACRPGRVRGQFRVLGHARGREEQAGQDDEEPT